MVQWIGNTVTQAEVYRWGKQSVQKKIRIRGQCPIRWKWMKQQIHRNIKIMAVIMVHKSSLDFDQHSDTASCPAPDVREPRITGQNFSRELHRSCTSKILTYPSPTTTHLMACISTAFLKPRKTYQSSSSFSFSTILLQKRVGLGSFLTRKLSLRYGCEANMAGLYRGRLRCG